MSVVREAVRAPTLFERACRGERLERPPIWVMRQAGRYLPEYRALRAEHDFLTTTRTPELATLITLQPMRRFELDAAILFSDIMTPLEGMGVEVRFGPGPIIDAPVRTPEQARSLALLEPEERVPHVLEAVRMVRAELPRDRALIGFAGAPFTLLCYLVQGSGSKDFMEARAFLAREPSAAGELLHTLAASMGRYLVAQARAGADALMLFDSWAGLLSPAAYGRYVLGPVQEMVSAIRREVGVPLIYFAPGGGALLQRVREVGADVVGVDWTVGLSEAAARLGTGAVVQGNLDPAALFADRRELSRAVDDVLREGRSAAAHVFNLGHGIHATTDPDQLAYVVDRVHAARPRGAAPADEAAFA